LADLNDQYCYLSLVDARIFPQIAEAAQKHPEWYTTDLFPDEPAAGRLHVRLRSIEKFRRDTGDLARASFFSTSYEVVRHYLLDVASDLGAETLSQGEAVETHLGDRVTYLGAALDNTVISTLEYLRLRLNQLTHRLPRGNVGLRALVKHRGAILNKRWRMEETVDFSTIPSLRLPDDECVGLLRLLRILVEEIDDVAARALDPFPVIESLHRDIVARDPRMQSENTRSRLATKIRRAGLHMYGLEEDNYEEVAHWLAEKEST